MSLAETMVRLSRGKPDRRYAMDPAHVEAIRNYLSLMSRGYNVPRIGRAAQPRLGAVLGDKLPLFNELLRGVTQDADPAALAGALDVHAETTGQDIPPDGYYVGNEPHQDLIALLAGMHHGAGMANVLTDYTHDNLNVGGNRVMDYITRIPGFFGNMNSLIGSLRQGTVRQRRPVLADQLAGQATAARRAGYHPLATRGLYDVLDRTDRLHQELPFLNPEHAHILPTYRDRVGEAILESLPEGQ